MDLLIFADAAIYNLIGLSFVVLGVTTLIRYTGFPDLTVDGSFTLAAALFAAVVARGAGTVPALAAAALAGAASGLMTWLLNACMGMGRVVSSVLAMITLILVAPYISGGASISLLRADPLHQWLGSIDAYLLSTSAALGVYQLHFATIAFWGLAFVFILLIWRRLFRTRSGLQLRYLGSVQSPTLISPPRRKWFLLAGLVAGNLLVGLGGAIEAARRGAYTANMGIGTLLTGLAIMILGEALMKMWKRRDFLHPDEQIMGLVLGLLVYGVCIQLILRFGPGSIDLRLASTIILMVLLATAARFFPNSAKLF
jgi:putative tryptophan/tyrosine transport system permease protein